MNIGKSVKVALAQQEKNVAWLATQAGVTRQSAWRYSVSPDANSKTIKNLSRIFDMSESEFVALGE